jgi:5-methyltetrahydrofolate--homocysteine methyltransferase
LPFDIQEATKTNVLISDGPVGTMLQSMGLAHGERTELWNRTHPDAIVGLHRSYLRAGADFLKTNTFGANRYKFPAGSAHSVDGVIEAAFAHARTAIAEANAADKIPVVFSMGPLGKLLEPYGDLPFEEAYDAYCESFASAAKCGADAILIETISDTNEMRAAILAAKRSAPGVPFWCTFSVDENGRLLSGALPAAAALIAQSMGAAAVGVNCGAGPERATAVVPDILAVVQIPVIAKPNAGSPTFVDGKAVYTLTPEHYAEEMETLLHLGCKVLGGCCGNTPEHIQALAKRCKPIQPRPTVANQQTSSAYIASPREILLRTEVDPNDLEEYDPDDLQMEPLKITANNMTELEEKLFTCNATALVLVPDEQKEAARALVKIYGGIVA